MINTLKYFCAVLILSAIPTSPLVAQQPKEVDLQIEISKTIQAIRAITKPTESPYRPALIHQFRNLEYSPAARELAVARRRASLDGRFLGQMRGVGYRPIISFFPQGDMMTVGPVIVSPDRRYVRIGISAARTGIGHVYTFNFSTGEYRRLDNGGNK
jgi:hypothetical protein